LEKSILINTNLLNLFQPAFPTADLSVKKKLSTGFCCDCINECEVEVKEEAIWSPYFGDSNSKVMLIAEAPSITVGKGPHTGGMFKDSEFVHLKNFVKKYYNTVPHFTDVMKCGVSRQTAQHKSRVFKKRTKNCFEKYLIKEIEIIKPEVILCLGNTAFDAVNDEFNKADSRIQRSTKIIKLVHYSKQANLQLTIKDKEDIIWPIQIGKLDKENLKDLSKFRDI